jgi:uncharacterized membrane protein HdeD (DUF308 family)
MTVSARGVLALLFAMPALLFAMPALLWPDVTVPGLAVAFAWAIAVGLLEETAALAHLLDDPHGLRQRQARIGAWLVAVAGIASVVAGIVVLLRPEAGTAAPATVLGVCALIVGVLFLAAWCLRSDPVAVSEVR